jgi:hypothetical protein
MTTTASIRLSAALILAPLLASAQPADQSPPAAFQTPSGNVHCRWDRAALNCQVLSFETTPPEASRCTAPWQGWLALQAEGAAEAPCRGTPVRDDEAFVLGYGARWIGPGVTCDSDETGLRCANGAGHGFRAARAGITLF